MAHLPGMAHDLKSLDQAWDYICALWVDERLAQELLRRQDEESLDVILELFNRWVRHARNRPLSAEESNAAEALVRGWRDDTVRPLRQVRRTTRKHLEATGIAELAEARKAIQAAEMATERAQLAMLCDWIDAH